jgi:hypothetical protein
MASPETVGTCQCGNCGSLAYVKKNRGGLPYYRCGNCDEARQQHSQKGARIFLQKVTLFEAETPPPAAAKHEEKPPVAPALQPPKKPAKSLVATLLEM